MGVTKDRAPRRGAAHSSTKGDGSITATLTTTAFVVAALTSACQFTAPAEVAEVTVSGTVDGLWLPSSVELRLTSGDTVTTVRPAANGAFSFPTPVLSGTAFSVETTAGSRQDCTFSPASGVVTDPATEIAVVCAPPIDVTVTASASPEWTFAPGATRQSISTSILRQGTTFTINAPAATAITLDGAPQTSGARSPRVVLAPGDNDIVLEIQAGDLVGQYALTVNRGASPPRQRHYLKLTSALPHAQFGTAIAFDGTRLAISAPGDGTTAGHRIDVYRTDGTTWSLEQSVQPTTTGPDPTSSLFGYVLALQGDVLVVGAPGDDTTAGDSGAVYVFRYSATNGWREQAFEKPSSVEMGRVGMAVALDGTTMAVGSAMNQVYVYSVTDTIQLVDGIQPTPVAPQDGFGLSLDLSGDTLVVGSPYEGSSGRGVGGPDADATAPGSGAAYVYRKAGTRWNLEAFIKASNSDAGDNFGTRVSLDGDALAVTAWKESSASANDPSDNSTPGAGAAYVFERAGAAWSQTAILKSRAPGRDDRFFDVQIAGDVVVVTSPGEDSASVGADGDASNDGATDAGAALVFVRDGAAWTQRAYLKASNTGAGDDFGNAIALSRDLAVVGAPLEDNPAMGLDPPDQGDAPAGSPGVDSGAAYELE
ncbi:MAG: hypothetical protein JNK64_32680 [Myxococcales bacterium]|nr:hypothetical protein [Myxococcales bacterium]